MNWLEFVFSEKRKNRILRHALFWVIWWLYLTLCFYLSDRPTLGQGYPVSYITTGSFVLLKSFLLVLIYALATYALIYFLLPLMIKRKWLLAVSYAALLSLLLFVTAYCLYWMVFPFVDSLLDQYKAYRTTTKYWPAVYLGLITSVKVMVAATAIKYIKYWWLKQEESEKIKREKIITELQLLKAQVQPDFLFKTLNDIYAHALRSSPSTPDMLLRLSDILSYMLYECDQPLVPLEKEIAMIKDYMSLEKIRMANSVEIELTVSGDLQGKMIAPFLLLPFIEKACQQNNDPTENSWINMDISIDKCLFHMKWANDRKAGADNQPGIHFNDLTDVRKRLTLLYPQKHELKIAAEQEMQIVHLKIDLATTVPETKERLLDKMMAED